MFFRSSQPSHSTQQSAPEPQDDNRQPLIDILGQIGSGHFGAAAGLAAAPDALSVAVGKLASAAEHEAMAELRSLVQISSGGSHAMVEVAQMVRAVAAANHKSQTIAAASEELVTSVGEIRHSTELAAHEAELARSAAEAGSTAARHAIQSMDTINRAVSEAAAQVQTLAEASTQIGEIVNQIEAIAKQTNLLALNATIEAARAGEAGKGFAVVAGEVKTLANQTAKATDDIRARIARLRDEMGGIVRSMEESAKAVDQGRIVIGEAGTGVDAVLEQIEGISARMGEINTILSQQEQAAGEVAEGIQGVATQTQDNLEAVNDLMSVMAANDAAVASRMDVVLAKDIAYKVIEVAKSDHVAFKRRLYETIIGRNDATADKLATHHVCRLGKWYYAVTDERILKSPSFKALEPPHAAVHDHGKAALKRFEQHDYDGAMAEVQQVEKASAEVLRLLDSLSRELNA